ncbi:MAG: LamB/YcsF family protein [Sandaracinus sp.]
MRARLDIDLGELPEEPEALYAVAHLANVACGGHAGDRESVARAVALARAHGTQIGAHPSYPDREGFGRRAMAIAPEALAASIRAQCALLAAIAPAAHVKMHGALYHAIDRDEALARVVLAACRETLGEIEVLGPPEGATERVAGALGLRFLREGFADRGLMPDGSLVPRGAPGALLEDPVLAAEQARRLATSGRFDVLCVHGDGAHAVAIARAVREALDR